jgi:hypothetical protein
MEFAPLLVRQPRNGILSIEVNGLLETVEVRRTIWAAFEMASEFPTFGSMKTLVEVAAEICVHFPAVDSFYFHDVMYSLSCSLKNARARCSRDFTAGTVRFKIVAVSPADLPSTSLRMNTMR